VLLIIIFFPTEIQDYKRAEAFMKRAINIAEIIYANQPAMADVLVGLVGILIENLLNNLIDNQSLF
jgi:hypothetical protein